MPRMSTPGSLQKRLSSIDDDRAAHPRRDLREVVDHHVVGRREDPDRPPVVVVQVGVLQVVLVELPVLELRQVGGDRHHHPEDRRDGGQGAEAAEDQQQAELAEPRLGRAIATTPTTAASRGAAARVGWARQALRPAWECRLHRSCDPRRRGRLSRGEPGWSPGADLRDRTATGRGLARGRESSIGPDGPRGLHVCRQMTARAGDQAGAGARDRARAGRLAGPRRS